jgi:hypothetical protein
MRNSVYAFFVILACLNSSSIFCQDQSIAYASYLGGSGEEWVLSLDAFEDTWVLNGRSFSNNSPITANAFMPGPQGESDAYISVFDELGQLEYATYLGGSGEELDFGNIRLVDANRILVGVTSLSDDYPVTDGAFQLDNAGDLDAVVSLLNIDGDLLWSTYFGGEGEDVLMDVAYDVNGNIYITGYTQSDELASPGAYQESREGITGFLAKFNPDGSFGWSTYLGGEGEDRINAIEVDLTGEHVYVGGFTTSESGISNNGWQDEKGAVQDGFLACFNAINGTLDWATYYGGNNVDYITDIDFNQGGDIIVAGNSGSSDNLLATTGTHQPEISGGVDIFVASFTADGTRSWGTYYGGETLERFATIDIMDDNILLSGSTFSLSGIAYGNPLWPENINDYPDVSFVAKLNNEGQLYWGSFFFPEKPNGAQGFKFINNSKIAGTGSIFSGSAVPVFDTFLTENAFQSTQNGEKDITLIILEDETLSISERDWQPLVLFPNPSSQYVRIHGTHVESKMLNLMAYDLSGRVVESWPNYVMGSQLDISKFNAGAYILIGQSGDDFMRGKLIVE